jgi:hypothetical protein
MPYHGAAAELCATVNVIMRSLVSGAIGSERLCAAKADHTVAKVILRALSMVCTCVWQIEDDI